MLEFHTQYSTVVMDRTVLQYNAIAFMLDDGS